MISDQIIWITIGHWIDIIDLQSAGLDGSAEDSGICWIRCNFTDDSLRLFYLFVTEIC